MNRRERQPDGTSIVWRERIVTMYDAGGDVLESRPLTDAERTEFEAWQDAQPDGARVRAWREAHTQRIAELAAVDAQMASAVTLRDLIAAIRARRS